MFYTETVSDKPVKTVLRDTNVLLKRIKAHLNREIHLKIDGDDSPITYHLREVGRDYVVVTFAQMERTIPISRIIFMQVELGSVRR